MRVFAWAAVAAIAWCASATAQSPRVTDWMGTPGGSHTTTVEDRQVTYDRGPRKELCPDVIAHQIQGGLRFNSRYQATSLVTGVKCGPTGCGDRRYQCTGGYQTMLDIPSAGRQLEGSANCADTSRDGATSLAAGWDGRTLSCAGLIEAEGRTAICGKAEQTKTLAAGEELRLKSDQIVQSVRCDSVECKELEVKWCGVYGGDAEGIRQYLSGVRWKRVGSMTGGSQEYTYTFGVEQALSESEEASEGASQTATSGSSQSQSYGSATTNSFDTSSEQSVEGSASFGRSFEFYAEATIGAEVSGGFMGIGASASASATAGFNSGTSSATSETSGQSRATSQGVDNTSSQDTEFSRMQTFAATEQVELTKAWNREFSAKTERAVTISCDQVGGADFRQNFYAFTLLADNGMEAVMGNGYNLCTYAPTQAPDPVCLPNDCDNAFATNCQKCRVASIGQIFDKPSTPIVPLFTSEPQPFGSFVEFEGLWSWADEVRTGTSYLVLFNGSRASAGQYTLCNYDQFGGDEAPTCAQYRGKYTAKPRGATLDLLDVFQKGSLMRFERVGDGTIAAKFWAVGRDASLSSKSPDGTAAFTQNSYTGRIAGN